MDQSKAPLLDAWPTTTSRIGTGSAHPGTARAGGADERVLGVLGRDPFRADVLASGGLDDWRTSQQYLKQAEELMADAVGASNAFFSTCGSSLSVRAAMMAVAGGDGGLLVPRDSHSQLSGA